MGIWNMMIREVGRRKLGFALALLGVSAAVASLISALTVLRLHDIETERILAHKEAETEARMRALRADVKKAMARLGYNAIILPRDQPLGDWYAEDYASKTMPESSVEALSKTRGLAERLLPRLRQKVKWREKKWTVIVVGVGRERKLAATVSGARPLVKPLEPGTCAVGYELHSALGLKAGDPLTILGRTFRIATCEKELGTKDDITIWLNLADAQRLLGKPGQVNEILIVEDLSVWGNVKEARRKAAAVLPGCQLIQMASETMARAQARRKVAEEANASVERERAKRALMRAEIARTAWKLVPLGFVVCAAWIGFLMYLNVKDRVHEIGILMAIGFQSRQVLSLILSKSTLLGVLGGVFGFVAGTGIPLLLEASAPSMTEVVGAGALGLAVSVAIVVCLLASWWPARMASRTDPAEVLRET